MRKGSPTEEETRGPKRSTITNLHHSSGLGGIKRNKYFYLGSKKRESLEEREKGKLLQPCRRGFQDSTMEIFLNFLFGGVTREIGELGRNPTIENTKNKEGRSVTTKTDLREL